jgi:hypothetical protein
LQNRSVAGGRCGVPKIRHFGLEKSTSPCLVKKKPSKFAIQTPSPSPKFGASSPMNSSSVPPFCSRAWFTPSNTTSSLVENEAGGLGWDQNVGILFVGEMLVLFVGGPTFHQHYFINMFCSIKSGPKNQNDYITKMCYFIIFLHHQLFIKSLKSGTCGSIS